MAAPRTALAALILLVGLGAACSEADHVRAPTTEWHLYPGAPRPDASSREFTVVVADNECASGRSHDELIVGEQVTYSTHEIAVRFKGKKLSGYQTCPGPFPMWATRAVRLSEPIGERRIVDTGPGEPGRERYPNDQCAVIDINRSTGCPVPPPPNVSVLTTATTTP